MKSMLDKLIEQYYVLSNQQTNWPTDPVTDQLTNERIRLDSTQLFL